MSPQAEPKDSGSELEGLRAELAGVPLETGRVERVYRQLATHEALADLRVAWLGNHTLDPVLRHATVAAFAHGALFANQVGGYGQHFQALLDAQSELHAHQPDAIVLSLSLRQLAPRLVSGGAGMSEQWRREEAQRVLDNVSRWVEAAKSRTNATLLVCNFVRPPRPGLGVADARKSTGDASVFGWLNEELAATYREDPAVFVVDVDSAIASAGRLATWQPQMYHLAKIEWSGPGLAAAGEAIARTLRALVRPARKCLLLDLDNTLWGGIIGEDGIGGLRVLNGDTVGEAYLAFQHAILDVKARGILLAIVSKNNREDVDEAFRELEMPLTRDDFAAARIDWEHKHLNIKSIAAELNVGLDSMVFVDDNPVECELIRQMLPAIEIIDLPADPAEYADRLLASWHFDKIELTEEDLRKTEQYRDNAARATVLQDATDLASYLESLGTRVEIGGATERELPRLHQLFSKTNQFNLTTKRYSLAELRQFMQADEWLFEWVRVRDNFGDLGLVGTYLVRFGTDEAEIDSLIMSCRAMGREIETGICNTIKARVFATGVSVLSARFEPTQKNKPVVHLYDNQGFQLVETDAGGAKLYRLTAEAGKPLECRSLEVVTVRETA